MLLVLGLALPARDAAADQISDKRAEAATLSATLADQARSILGLDKEHRRAEERLTQAQSALAQAEVELGGAQRRQEEARQLLVVHAQRAYMTGGSASVVGRMTQGSGDTIVARTTYLRMVHGEDRLAVGRLRSTREDLELRRASLTDATRRAGDEASALARDKNALDRALASQQAVFSTVSGELAGLVAAEQRKAAEADAQRAAQLAQTRAAEALAARAVPAAQAKPIAAVPLASSGPASTIAATPAGSPLSMDEAFACIRQLESGNNYAAPNGGAYQFLDSTWHSLGYTGSAQDYPPAVQDKAARDLQARSGWGQWAVAPRCGLV
jgi:septal ring factor EnvC (AmiA/AmiB activator)